MSAADEPDASNTEQFTQWPPPIDAPRFPGAPPPKPKVSLAILVSATDTIGLFFVWGILSVLMSGAWSKGFSLAPVRFVVDAVMPLAIGLAASYRWRSMGFRLGAHLLLLCLDIGILTIWASILFAGLLGTGGNPFTAAAHAGVAIPADRLEAGLASIALIVVGSLIGRVMFAPKRPDAT